MSKPSEIAKAFTWQGHWEKLGPTRDDTLSVGYSDAVRALLTHFTFRFPNGGPVRSAQVDNTDWEALASLLGSETAGRLQHRPVTALRPHFFYWISGRKRLL